MASAESTSTYQYGPSGMREKITVTAGGTTRTTQCVYDGATLVAECDSDGTTYRYLWGPDRTPLALEVSRPGRAASVYTYHTDAAGSVVALTDAAGLVVAEYRYDAFGGVAYTGGTDPALASRNPLRYRSYHYDAETALYYLPARYYEPETARFLSPDPAPPSAGDPLSLNAYTYCQGDPVNAEDPSGAYHSARGGASSYEPEPPMPPDRLVQGNAGRSGGGGGASTAGPTMGSAPFSGPTLSAGAPDLSPYGRRNGDMRLSKPGLGEHVASGVWSLLTVLMIAKIPAKQRIPRFDQWAGQQWWVREVTKDTALWAFDRVNYEATLAAWEQGYATQGDVEQARLNQMPIINIGAPVGTFLFHGYAETFGYEYAKPYEWMQTSDQ